MKNILFFLVFPILSFSNDTFLNMKSCEKIQVSKYTALISCHNIDYLIEYKFQDDEEKDNIKKITALTVKDKKIIMNESK